jgi:hypothetical protein
MMCDHVPLTSHAVGRTVGEVEQHVCSSREAFRATMYDLVGTNEIGRLTPQGFVRYLGIPTEYGGRIFSLDASIIYSLVFFTQPKCMAGIASRSRRSSRSSLTS